MIIAIVGPQSFSFGSFISEVPELFLVENAKKRGSSKSAQAPDLQNQNLEGREGK